MSREKMYTISGCAKRMWDYWDVELISRDNAKFRAHKVFLGTGSHFFAHFKKNAATIRLDLSRDQMRLLMKLIYIHDYQPTSKSEAEDIAIMTDYFLMDEAKKRIEKFFQERAIDLYDPLELFFFSKTYNMPSLRESCIELCASAFAKIVERRETKIFDLSIRELELLLFDGRLTVNCELALWNTIAEWGLRSKERAPVLTKLRLLSFVGVNCPGPCMNCFYEGKNRCVEFGIDPVALGNGLSCRVALEERRLEINGGARGVTRILLTPRRSYLSDTEFLIFDNVAVGRGGTNIRRFDFKNRSRPLMVGFRRVRHQYEVVARNELVFMLGGTNARGKELNVACSLNLSSRVIAELPKMISAKYNFACTMVGDVIFAFGGRTISGVTDSAEKYRLGDKQWNNLFPMAAARTCFTATGVEESNRIYLIGGYNGLSELESRCEIYSIDENQYTTVQFPLGIACHQSVLFDKKIYIFGGDRDLCVSDILYYDVTESVATYLMLTGAKLTRSWFTAVHHRDNAKYVSVMGGTANGVRCTEMLTVDLSNIRAPFRPYPMPLSFINACAIETKYYHGGRAGARSGYRS